MRRNSSSEDAPEAPRLSRPTFLGARLQQPLLFRARLFHPSDCRSFLSSPPPVITPPPHAFPSCCPDIFPSSFSPARNFKKWRREEDFVTCYTYFGVSVPRRSFFQSVRSGLQCSAFLSGWGDQQLLQRC